MISAANSDDDEKGFLNQRAFKYRTVKVTSSDKTETVYLTRGGENHKHDEPLDKRGWTLQEQYLAARTIRFCKTQMVWQCRKMSRSECSDSFGEPLRKDLQEPFRTDFLNLVTNEFSQRTLSYDTDKLPARKDNYFFCSSTPDSICIFLRGLCDCESIDSPFF